MFDKITNASEAHPAWRDLLIGMVRVDLWGRLGWLEVKRRYRRTLLGPLWSSVALALYTIAVGVVGAGLFNQNIEEYLPYLSAGMITWTFISSIILEGCAVFTANGRLLQTVRLEYSVLVYALVWRNFVILLHNLIGFVLIAAALKPSLIGLSILYALPGLFLLLVNATWIGLLLGLVCLRFRDVQPLAQIFTQICMLITPIFWTSESLSGTLRLFFVQFNPIYRLIDLVRTPLMGEMPTLASWISVLLIAVAGWSLALLMFSRFRRRLVYWA